MADAVRRKAVPFRSPPSRPRGSRRPPKPRVCKTGISGVQFDAEPVAPEASGDDANRARPEEGIEH